jgi:hypothetical protein
MRHKTKIHISHKITLLSNKTARKITQTIKDTLHTINTTQKKVKLSLQQAVEAYGVVRCRGSHIVQTVGSQVVSLTRRPCFTPRKRPVIIYVIILIIGFCILLRVILTVNNNTFCFATIDKDLLNSLCTHDTFRPLLGHHQVNLQNIKKKALFIQRIRRVE